jgi:hypothetical protein
MQEVSGSIPLTSTNQGRMKSSKVPVVRKKDFTSNKKLFRISFFAAD